MQSITCLHSFPNILATIMLILSLGTMTETQKHTRGKERLLKFAYCCTYQETWLCNLKKNHAVV